MDVTGDRSYERHTESTEIDVTGLRCLVSRANEIVGMFDIAMIYLSGVPYAVFAWERQSNGCEKPLHMTELDPRLLTPLPGWGEISHLYRVPVSDPRPFS